MYKTILLIIAVLLILNGTGNALVFFPEDGEGVSNFTKALPEGYDDPAVIYGEQEEQPEVLIHHLKPLKAKKSEDFSITAKINNLPKGGIVLAHYKFDPLSQYRNVPMKEMTPGRFAVTIPSHLLEGDRIEYYIDVSLAGTRLANAGDYGSPYSVVLIGGGGVSKFAIFALAAVGGVWLVSKINSKSTGKGNKQLNRRRA